MTTARVVLAAGCLVALSAAGIVAWQLDAANDDASSITADRSSTTDERGTSSSATTSTLPPRRSATLVFGGDVLIHSGVWEAARTESGFDFSPMLDPIAAQLTAADLAICHLEVTLAREGDALSSYPRFRAPRELATDIHEAGFDGCSVSSNHALDFGEQGVVATLDALDAAGLGHAGTARSTAEDAAAAQYVAGGIRVAHLSYAYGFNGYTEPAGKGYLADEIDPAMVLADAAAARTAGAEVVIVSMHWGNEYDHDVVAAQQIAADAIAAVPGAVDLIVGHHAHVVQPISKVGGMWVVWGMGNLLSNNSPGCCPAPSTDGVLVTVSIGDVAPGGAQVAVEGITFTPTWNERTDYRVLPAAATLRDPAVPPALASDLRESFDRTSGYILGLGAGDLGVRPDLVPPAA